MENVKSIVDNNNEWKINEPAKLLQKNDFLFQGIVLWTLMSFKMNFLGRYNYQRCLSHLPTEHAQGKFQKGGKSWGIVKDYKWKVCDFLINVWIPLWSTFMWTSNQEIRHTFKEFPVCNSFFRISPERKHHFRNINSSINRKMFSKTSLRTSLGSQALL